jgi:CheY-like chemotaxis protein
MSASPRKILCVEDSPDMQQMLKIILDKAGFEVDIAIHGREGIKKAKATRPDLIVMDIMMPDVSGIQAIKRIKADSNCQSIPIVVLSAYISPKLVQEALEAGAAVYLEKSILPEKLVKTIHHYLDHPNGS